MQDFQFSVQNIIDNNGFGISVVGVGAVFLGLLMIFFFISAMPSVLGKVEKILGRMGITIGGHGHGHGHAPVVPKPPKSTAVQIAPDGEVDPDTIAAIAYVIAAEAELETLTDYTKITIRRDDSQQVWGVAGRMRTLAKRNPQAK
jgi:hypothetical protein